MTEQRMMLVLLAVACCLLEVSGAQVAVAQTICSSSDASGCQSGAAQSVSTGPNGITTGECAYINPRGQSIKIKFEEYPDGKINADANNAQVEPLSELRQCREAVAAAQLVAQQNYNAVSSQIQAEHQQLQEQLQRQQQQLQEDIFRQHQAIFNQRNFPFPNGFNPLRFPNFPQLGFGGF
ncbi:uncharacterized protein [Macrobrachium rosenbergii]|uniref:uncharacterized protein isoform X1 n=1 Tax=Macrobrachium rosenbergii TaxID=79674 RepID=UPI0034D4DF95